MSELKKEQLALSEEDLEQVVGAGDEMKEDLGVDGVVISSGSQRKTADP